MQLSSVEKKIKNKQKKQSPDPLFTRVQKHLCDYTQPPWSVNTRQLFYLSTL